MPSVEKSKYEVGSLVLLRGREWVTAKESAPSTLRLHARDLITKRLAPAEPYKDGKQTPYRGHPVFVAQHATATCCRSSLMFTAHTTASKAEARRSTNSRPPPG